MRLLRGDYALRHIDDIYLDDLAYILDPNVAAREFSRYIKDQRQREAWPHASFNMPTLRGPGINGGSSWEFLNSIRNGRQVLVRNAFSGQELQGVFAGKDKLKADLPLALRHRLGTIIASQLKRPLMSVRPVADAPVATYNDNLCRPADNPLANGVFVWTEVMGAGHVFVSVHQDNVVHVYTYGRYGHTACMGLTGDGVLNYLVGESARDNYRDELYRKQARVFLIADADIVKIRLFFETAWAAGKKVGPLPEDKKVTQERGRIIDGYDVTGSNCATHSQQGISAAGSTVFTTEVMLREIDPAGLAEQDFTIPTSVQRWLLRKARSVKFMNVVDVTDDFKRVYPNSENLTVNKYKPRAIVEKAMSESLSAIGAPVGYSGKTVDGLLGGICDAE